MLTLLSPAKKLVTPAFDPNLTVTAPILGKSAQELSVVTKKLTRAQIRQMMKLSDNLTELTFARFQELDISNKSKGTPAVLTFAGDVYRGLQADTLLPTDLDFAQNSLRILSGLYGVLKPLDIIQPYRLEMGRKITTSHGEDLYDFWNSQIAEQLNKELQEHKFPVIINLASNEYFKAVDKKSLSRTIISPVFKEEKDGQQRILSVFAKLARGLMARWIVQNRITDPADLQNFDIAGYRFCPEGSTADKPLFVRPQPQKKAA
ncbi:MAG: peroxide stress protein YaaA [Robiginitomaculum sp.]|nr:peroxide stress protein YaaA [Robiginitomaculum sp.]